MGGYLAELTTKEEDIPLENHLVQGFFYWIGLSDAATEGTWRWMESDQIATYTNWWHGEGHDGTGNNCAFISIVPSGGGWADAPCKWTEWSGDQIHALCEM